MRALVAIMRKYIILLYVHAGQKKLGEGGPFPIPVLRSKSSHNSVDKNSFPLPVHHL